MSAFSLPWTASTSCGIVRRHKRILSRSVLSSVPSDISSKVVKTFKLGRGLLWNYILPPVLAYSSGIDCSQVPRSLRSENFWVPDSRVESLLQTEVRFICGVKAILIPITSNRESTSQGKRRSSKSSATVTKTESGRKS